MPQADTKTVTIKSLMHKRYFNIGYQEVLNGESFNPEYDKWDISVQADYERGRQFAIATDCSLPVKTGKHVNYSAMVSFADLYRHGVII